MKTQTGISNKEPWLAVILSSIWSGIGQMYAGHTLRGIVLIITEFNLSSLVAWLILSPEGSISLGFQVLISLLILSVFSLFDAHRCVRKSNDSDFEMIRRRDKDPWLSVFLSTLIPGLGHAYQKKWLFALLFFFSIFGLGILSETFPLANIMSLSLAYICFYHAYMFVPTSIAKSKKLILSIGSLLIIFSLLNQLFSFSLKEFIVEARYIPAESMEPTLKNNDRVIIDKLFYRFNAPQRRDIIIFAPTTQLKQQNYDKPFVKRIIGLPGENLEVKNGKVWIDDQPLRESYISEPPQYQFGSIKVPPNSFFVLGDNRNNSYDSHYWGFVPKSNIIGKVTKIYWPVNRSGPIE